MIIRSSQTLHLKRGPHGPRFFMGWYRSRMEFAVRFRANQDIIIKAVMRAQS